MRGPTPGPEKDALERILSLALEAATKAGDLSLVDRIVEEIRMRRLAASPNVVALPVAKKGGPR